jgi:integrase
MFYPGVTPRRGRDGRRTIKQHLTAPAVDGAKAKNGQRLDIWDTKVAGFGLRVTETGAKSWCVMYRHRGRLRRLTLGTYPKLTLADARDAARSALRAAQLGDDPARTKKQARAADTFGELARLYLDRHAKIAKRSWDEDERILRHDPLPVWANRKANDITRRDVIDLLDAIIERGSDVMANRVRALVSKIFNFAIVRDIAEHNPAYRVPRPGVENQRDRVLNEAEIRALWKALDQERTDIAALFRLMLLTAQRKGEVFGMAWAELDLEGGWWTIPAERAKNGLSHRVPLAPQSLAILQDLRSNAKDSLLVFPARVNRPVPIVNAAKWWARLVQRAVLIRCPNARLATYRSKPHDRLGD